MPPNPFVLRLVLALLQMLLCVAMPDGGGRGREDSRGGDVPSHHLVLQQVLDLLCCCAVRGGRGREGGGREDFSGGDAADGVTDVPPWRGGEDSSLRMILFSKLDHDRQQALTREQFAEYFSFFVSITGILPFFYLIFHYYISHQVREAIVHNFFFFMKSLHKMNDGFP